MGEEGGGRKEEGQKEKESKPPDRRTSNVWEAEKKITVHRKRGRGGSRIPGVVGGWEGTECFCGYDEACTNQVFPRRVTARKRCLECRSEGTEKRRERGRDSEGEMKSPQEF